VSSIYQAAQLPNGVRVVTAEMPHMHSVSVGLWVGTGSRYEPAQLNGVCHFIEHMLFKGTARRTAREISEAVEGVGGHLNAFTSEETTCFHARVSHDHFAHVMEVLFDMLLHSRFDKQDIRKEREVIKDEISMYQDEPQNHVQELLNATLWPGHPLGRPITGTPKVLDGIGRAELANFLRAHYGTGTLVVSAAGRVRHTSVARLARELSRELPQAKPGSAQPPDRRNDRRVNLLYRKVEQTQIALGMRTCSRHDPRRFALRLLNAALGENMSSRLFQSLREDRGLVYSVYSQPSFFGDTGDLVISAGMDTGNLQKVLRLITSELRTFARQPLTSRELEGCKDYVLGQIDLACESTETQMNWLGEQMLGFGRLLEPAQVKRRLATVSPSDIQSVAAQLFAPENFRLALISPLRDPHPVERWLG
jgi:predicted Zn-dependent peptidase